MSLSIARFLDLVRAAESRNQREIVITLTEARDLHVHITKLLLALESKNTEPEPTIKIEMRGEDF